MIMHTKMHWRAIVCCWLETPVVSENIATICVGLEMHVPEITSQIITTCDRPKKLTEV